MACFSDGCFVESEAEYAPDTSAKSRTVEKAVAIADVAKWLANEIITSGPYTCSAMAQKIGSVKSGGNGMLASKGMHSKCWEALKKMADEEKAFTYLTRGNATWFGTEEKLREMSAPKQYAEG